MNKFFEELADIFEIEPGDIRPDMDFREEVEDWCSMMGFSILVLMEDDYGIKLSVEEFLECRTVEDLYKKTQK